MTIDDQAMLATPERTLVRRNLNNDSSLSVGMSQAKRVFGSKIGERYEDQVIPAMRQGAPTLEEQIQMYEQ